MLLFTGTFAFLLLLTGCSLPFCTKGSGNIVSEERNVPIFHSVEFNGSGNLYITQDNKKYLKIETDDNLLPNITAKVTDGVLEIGRKKSWTCSNPTGDINVWVSMDNIEKISVNGSAVVFGETEITTNNLEVQVSGSGNVDLVVNAKNVKTNLSGSGDIKIRGSAESHVFDLSGSGKLDAFDLATKKTDLNISGSGRAEVTAKEELNVDVSGSGDIYYKGGSAEVNQSISGSGSVILVEDNVRSEDLEDEVGRQVLEEISKIDERMNEVPIEESCEQDSDCACGTSNLTGLCFVGNKEFVNANEQCSDFCTGIGGDLKMACVESTCKHLSLSEEDK